VYNLETKAICCHTHFGLFLGSYWTWGGGEGLEEEEVGIFVDYILQFLMQY
jgi:hypothetical protein